MKSLNVIVDNKLVRVDISSIDNVPVVLADAPYYARVDNLDKFTLEIFYAFHEEKKDVIRIGKTEIVYGVISGKIYAFKSEVAVNEEGFVSPEKFHDKIKNQMKDNQYDVTDRFKINILYNIKLIQLLVQVMWSVFIKNLEEQEIKFDIPLERQIFAKALNYFQKKGSSLEKEIHIPELIQYLLMEFGSDKGTVINGVLSGLYALKYIKLTDDKQAFFFTKKGYDISTNKELFEKLVNAPWILPTSHENQNWDKLCNKFVKEGIQGNGFYISGPAFYSLVSDFVDDIPLSYSKYIEERRQKELSTSRKDYFIDLIGLIDDSKKYAFYIKCQTYIEDQIISSKDDLVEMKELNPITFEKSHISKEVKVIENSVGDSIRANMQKQEHPKVFISYSGDSEEHKNWVLNLAVKLRKDGIDVILDQFNLTPGDSLELFMNKSIKDSQKVIMILTPKYKEKSEDMSTGSGYECIIGTAEMRKSPELYKKYIPVIKEGFNDESIPIPLMGKLYVDMRKNFEEGYKQLVMAIYEVFEHKIPPIGEMPDFCKI